MKNLYLAVALVSLALSPALPATAQDIVLNGAGSTFVNPAMIRWTEAYHKAHPNVNINYQSLGSGAGIGLYSSGTVDFGATDTPMTDAQIAGATRKPVHIPVIAGAVTVAYNLPDAPKNLHLSSEVIANIFLGKITKWDDSHIAKQNPSVKLPALEITVCRRSDSSGTTFIFTDYLSGVSPEWASKVGKGKLVRWPVGKQGKGNSGVGDAITTTPGGIGYVELAYALKKKLNYAAVGNARGKFIVPSAASTQAALAAVATNIKTDMRLSLVNAAGDAAYPICGVTYILIPETPNDATKARAVTEFLKWVIGPGQEIAASLSYAPLPRAVAEANLRALSRSGKNGG